MIHLDTSFLIDLLREIARGRPGGALDLAESFDDNEVLAVWAQVVCELRTGAELARRPLEEHETLDRLLGRLLVTYPDVQFASMYGRLLGRYSVARTRSSSRDLLIATAALLDDTPLATRNVKDFSRVPGLRILQY